MNPNTRLTYRMHLLLLVSLLNSATAPGQQARPDALAAARQAFDAGQYSEAVRTIAKELSQNREVRNPGPSPQRYDLLMLKGESLMRMNQRTTAADAFAQAQNSATEPKEAAMALANSLLARESPNNKYTSRRNRTSPPIDILDPESRRRAAGEMKDDRMATLAPKLTEAQRAETLPVMFEVLKPLLEIAALEFAANGSAEQTHATLTELGTHARDLINAELKRINFRINVLEDAANSVESGGVLLARRGLYSTEADEVRHTIEYLKQIEKTARDVRRMAQQLGYQAQAWEPISADCSDLIDRAQALLNTPS